MTVGTELCSSCGAGHACRSVLERRERWSICASSSVRPIRCWRQNSLMSLFRTSLPRNFEKTELLLGEGAPGCAHDGRPRKHPVLIPRIPDRDRGWMSAP